MSTKKSAIPASANIFTVGELLQQVFPQGTSYKANRPKTVGRQHYDLAPLHPFDLFAASGLLLQRAAAYQRILPEQTSSGAPNGSLIIKEAMSRLIRRVGKEWAEKIGVHPEVQKLWTKLLLYWDWPLFHEAGPIKPEKWWGIAFQLMAISDEASEDVGYWPTDLPGKPIRWPVELATFILNGKLPRRPKSGHIKVSNSRPSLTSALVNQDMVCVQPKARTPDVGCCIRNLSHNLALLPPRGVMRVQWMTPPSAQGSEETEALNVLLVPFPYRIEPSWFMAGKPEQDWNWFELRQRWLSVGPQAVIDLVKALLAVATAKAQIHSVVFPEYALDWETYELLAIFLRDNYPSVQFLVGGSSKNCAGDEGNFALASHFFPDPDVSGAGRIMASVSRPKHHRWAMDSAQAKSYALGSEFDDIPAARWWEKIPLRPREIYVNAMRSASVFSAMICEDLARAEPAHEPLRAVGPNLIFVLLMDGPQLERRWSCRYSTVLADDPGSSVLTITSRALVARWNSLQDPSEHSWSIGLWKDEGHRAHQINCPPGTDAFVLKLEGKREKEATLDGRVNDQTFSWRRIDDDLPIKLDRTLHADLLKKFGL